MPEPSALRVRCAGCGSEAGASRAAAILGGPVEVKIKTARLVGGYAVNFEFAPASHSTGIFTFGQLRELGSTEPNSAPDKCLNRH